MTGEVKPSTFDEIRNLLIVIFGAIVIASLGAAFMLYYYGPTGRYYAQNVLISPFTPLIFLLQMPIHKQADRKSLPLRALHLLITILLKKNGSITK